MINLTRSQILDALRRHAGEDEKQCSTRLGCSKRSVSSYINHPESIYDKLWIRILGAYGVTLEDAEAIAAEMPLLKKSAVQLELERRQEEMENNLVDEPVAIETRNPLDRPAGAVKWWMNDPNYFFKGSATPPVSFDPDQKIYTMGHSLVLMCIDALKGWGSPTTKQEVCDSYTWNRGIRTAETAQSVKDSLGEQAAAYIDVLVASGDIILEGDQYELAGHVYDSIVHQQVGDIRFGTAVVTGGQPNAEYLSFTDRYNLLEDCIYAAMPTISQRTGIAITTEEKDAIYLRTGLPREVSDRIVENPKSTDLI